MTERTTYQQTRLAGLQMGFGVDVSEAQHLSGPELDAWLSAAGLQDLREMKQERERGYRLPPA